MPCRRPRLRDHMGGDVPGLLHGENRILIAHAERHIGADIGRGVSKLRHAGGFIEAAVAPERWDGIAEARRLVGLALAVILVATRAEISIDLLPARGVRRRGWVGDRKKSHAGHAHALRCALSQILEIGNDGLHLRTVCRKLLAVHAADHAAIDALLERDHLVVDHHGKASVGRNERGAEGPQSGIQMAVHASEVIASVALRRIGRVLADMGCRIDD